MGEFICSMPECQTTAGCLCRKAGIISDPVPSSAYPSFWLADHLATARRQGFEAAKQKAAKVADDEDGGLTTWGEDRNTKVSQKTASDIAAAIRAMEDDG